MVLAFLMVLTLMPVDQRWAQTDVVLVAALPVILVTGGAIRLFCHQRMSLSVVDIAVATWMVYYVCRTWVGAEFPCRTEFLKTTTMFLLYMTLRLTVAVPIRWLAVMIVLCGAIEASWGLGQLMTGSSRHGLYLITGSFNNPGPYSAYLVMAALTAMIEYEGCSNKFLRYFLGGAVAICLAAFPATWSRAAFVSLAICLLWIYRRKYWRYRYLLWGGLAIAAIAFYYFKQGSADGRMVIWRAALTSWLSSPWLGVGTGGFCHAFAEGMAKLSSAGNINLDSAGVTMYSYNSLVGILTEQGVVGLTICMLAVGVAMWRLHNVSRALFFAILPLLIFSLFSYPFELLPYKILLVMCVALSTSVDSLGISRLKMKGLRIKVCYVANFILSSITLIPMIHLYTGVKETYEADREYATFKGMTEEIFLEDYHRLLPQEEDNAEFLFDYGQTLRIAGRYNDSNDILRRGAQVSADPMFYVLMGNNYKDTSLYNMAEDSYKKSFAVMPNRLYPLYQLMLLYQLQTNAKTKTKTAQTNNEKLRDVARRIVAIKPKIESPATRDMQRAAIQVLQEQ